MNTIATEHFNRIIFHKSGPAHKQCINQSINLNMGIFSSGELSGYYISVFQCPLSTALYCLQKSPYIPLIADMWSRVSSSLQNIDLKVPSDNES